MTTVNSKSERSSPSLPSGGEHDKIREPALLTKQHVDVEDETEDEEVKMNCIGGLRAVHDSDIYTSADDLSDVDEEEDKQAGVVEFVSGKNVLWEGALLRPKATTPPLASSRSPLHGDDYSCSDADDESSCTSSVGARGIPLAIDALTEDDSDDELAMDKDDSDDEDQENDDTESESSDEDETSQGEMSTVEDTADSGAARGEKEDEGDDEDENFEGASDDLSAILLSLGEEPVSTEPEELDSSERLIGVVVDQENDVITSGPKRVLSFSNLVAFTDARDAKRLCQKGFEIATVPSLLSTFSLGMPAIEESDLHAHRGSPVISSSSEEGDEEEYDRQLEEELAEDSIDTGTEKVPIPLLTPPGSPLTIEIDGGTATLCEWPSNLTVDSAMAAATELRSMSPRSLEKLERRDSMFEADESLHTFSGAPSLLTPILRGISVGN